MLIQQETQQQHYITTADNPPTSSPIWSLFSIGSQGLIPLFIVATRLH